MKLVLWMFVVLSFGFANAEESAAKGEMSKEEKKAMHEALKDEKSAVDSACAEEAKVAGCGDKVVGKGLLKCLHEHKKASKEFKVSDSCKSAMKSLKEERKKVKGKK